MAYTYLNPELITVDWEHNPRERDDEHIRSIAAHMNENGYDQKHPVIVYELEGDTGYHAATGHHRLAAAQLKTDEFPNLPLDEVFCELLSGTRADFFRRMLIDNFQHTPGFNQSIGKMPTRFELREMRYRLMLFPDNFAKGDRLLAKEWGCHREVVGSIRKGIIHDLNQGFIAENSFGFLTKVDIAEVQAILDENLYVGADGKKYQGTGKSVVRKQTTEKTDQSDSEPSDLERERDRADTNRKRMWTHISSEIRTKAGITHPELSDRDIAKAAAEALGLSRIEVCKEGVDCSFQAYKFIMGDIDSPAYSVYDCVLNDAIDWTDRFRKIYDDIENKAEWVVALLKSEEVVSGGVDALWEDVRSEMPAWETYFKTEGYDGKPVDVSGVTERLLLKTYRDVDEMEDATETDVGIILNHMQMRVPALALGVSKALKEDSEAESDATDGWWVRIVVDSGVGFDEDGCLGGSPMYRFFSKASEIDDPLENHWVWDKGNLLESVFDSFFTEIRKHDIRDLPEDDHTEETYWVRLSVETGTQRDNTGRLGIGGHAIHKHTLDTVGIDQNLPADLMDQKVVPMLRAEFFKGLRDRGYKLPQEEPDPDAGTPQVTKEEADEMVKSYPTLQNFDKPESESQQEPEPDWEQLQEEHSQRLKELPDEIKAYIPKWIGANPVRVDRLKRYETHVTLKLLLNARSLIVHGSQRGPDPFFKEEMEDLLERMKSNDVVLIDKTYELLGGWKKPPENASENESVEQPPADAPDMNALWADFNKRYPKWKAKYAESGYKENDLIQASTEAEMFDALRVYRESDRAGEPTADEVKDMTDLMNMQSYPFAYALREILRSKKEKDSETLEESEYGLDMLTIGYYKRGQSDIRYLSFKMIASRQLDEIPMKDLPELLRNEVLKLVEEESS